MRRRERGWGGSAALGSAGPRAPGLLLRGRVPGERGADGAAAEVVLVVQHERREAGQALAGAGQRDLAGRAARVQARGAVALRASAPLSQGREGAGGWRVSAGAAGRAPPAPAQKGFGRARTTSTQACGALGGRAPPAPGLTTLGRSP